MSGDVINILFIATNVIEITRKPIVFNYKIHILKTSNYYKKICINVY